MWIFEGEKITGHEDLHPECTDIIYEFTYTCGKKYVGKKTVRSYAVKPAPKAEKGDTGIFTRHILRDEEGNIITSKKGRKEARGKGLKAKAELYKSVYTDKPFLKYEGSSKETQDLEVVNKEIMYQCSNKKTATYIEAALLFELNVLFDENYVNGNILGSFYDNSLDGLL